MSLLSTTRTSPLAALKPWLTAEPKPRFSSFRSTRTRESRSASAARYSRVPSPDPLSTTITSASASTEFSSTLSRQSRVKARPSGAATTTETSWRRAPSRSPSVSGIGPAEHGLDRLRTQSCGPARDRYEIEGRRQRGTRTPPRHAHSDHLEQLAEHDACIEVVAREVECGLPGFRVVGLDRLERGDGLVDRREGEERLAGRQHASEAGVLRHHRPAGGEVGGTAVAEPAAAQADILVLRNGEFGPRAPDVVAVGVDVGGEVERRSDTPAAALEQLADPEACSWRARARSGGPSATVGRGTCGTPDPCSSRSARRRRSRRAILDASCRQSCRRRSRRRRPARGR